MDNQTFKEIIDANPTLTTDGFGTKDSTQFNQKRAELYTKEDEFDLAYEFIYWAPAAVRQDKWHFNKDSERQVGVASIEQKFDICEGAYIAAAIANGFGIQRYPKGTSCTFTEPQEVTS